MSDISSSRINISTDSEESFLMKQINKSQLFNSSSSSSNSSKKRRSFFRESYIDEFGADRTFSVYQDIIFEDTIDDSREVSNLSKLSQLDTEKLKTMDNNRSSILGELNLNPTVESLPSLRITKSNSLSRKNSMRKSRFDQQYQGTSIAQSTDGNISSELPRPEQLPQSRVMTPLIPLPRIPHPKSQQTPDQENEVIVSAIHSKNDPHIPHNVTGLRPFKLQSKPLGEKERSVSDSSSKTYGSAKSNFSDRTSLLNFELTRKKQIGTPHILLSSNDNNSLANHEILTTPGSMAPSPSNSFTFTKPFKLHKTETSIPDELKSLPPVRNGPDVLKMLQMNDSTSLKPEKKSIGTNSPDTRQHNTYSPYSDDNSGEEYHYNDNLLEKIYYYRRQPPTTLKGNTNMIWLVYVLSFLVPPLFFFLGFGLLDRCFYQYHVSPTIKRVSLITGTLFTIVTLAMIGVGFGYGIHHAQR